MLFFLCKNKNMKKRCPRPPRKHVSTTIDQALYDQLIPVIEKDWGGPFSTWLDYVATCWLQESCDDCPYHEEEGQEGMRIGQVEAKEEEG